MVHGESKATRHPLGPELLAERATPTVRDGTLEPPPSRAGIARSSLRTSLTSASPPRQTETGRLIADYMAHFPMYPRWNADFADPDTFTTPSTPHAVRRFGWTLNRRHGRS